MQHGPSFLRAWIPKLLIPAVGCAITVWAFGLLPQDAMSAAWQGLPDIAPWRCCLAIFLTAGSYFAMGRLEQLWHVTLRLNTQDYIARRTGRIAVAIGQCVGAASLIAGVLRWRLLRDTARASDVARVSLAVSLSFTFCWALSALAALWWVTQGWHPVLSWPLVAVGIAAAGLALHRYGPKVWYQRRLLLSVLGWAQADLLCAGLVFTLLAPPDLPLVQVLAVFLLAFGAGLASHVPMGLGAFDLIVIVFSPAPVAAMLPALLAFRLVYFVLPALCAGVAYWRPRRLPGRDAVRQLLRADAPAIWALSDQGATIWRDTGGAALVGHTPVARVLIGDPIGTVPRVLRTAARYKCSARSASRLRLQGWSVMRIATEALIDPCTWTTDGPARASLRRKLRQAQAAGVRVRLIAPDDMVQDVTRVAKVWARSQGGERGFSMGRFAVPHLRGQMVYGIFENDTLHGFVSFQTGPHDWCLDLIRHDGTLRAGAIQSAIVAGFDDAAAARVSRVNLAATIAQTGPFGWLGQRLGGLHQFKRSFDPQWSPLYHAAPDPQRFLWTAAALLWSVQRPHARLTNWAWQLCFPALHATEDANVRSGPTPQTEVTHDKRILPTARRARLDPRRWRNRDKPVQHGAFFRRRARDVERRSS